ncbi:sulfotransferase [Luteolibacter sp. Populi]|uniref:sulfotransferase family protein n=1 Tax=Luteolibacter sp. Populi TaxID=3230487 RepID=UPI00346515DD
MQPVLKHRWSISHNYLAGITAGDWFRLLRENRFAVNPVYWHRGTFVSLLSLVNSYHRRKEEAEFNARIAATQITKAPLFIIGHWRSGTTHLHNLLAQDDTRFAYANTYQVVNPHTFLRTEEINTRRFAWMIPKTRPMDNMALSFDSPQEDEFAPLLITLLSSYLGVSFPRREDHYTRYLSFAGVPRAETEAWKTGFEWFLKKLTFKHGADRALLLKSPPHTARIRLLLERFPDARFVHIHRRPEEVFQSFRHYYDTAMWHTYLQRPDRSRIDDEIIQRYRDLFQAYFADLDLIPPGNFHEVSFADLERDPIATVAGIYDALSIDGSDQALPKIKAYADTLGGYEKNRFHPLTSPEKQRLREAWSPIYERLGYRIE